ncbi:EAL domain-containing protein [Wenzhouxiangella sp. EGI_FJ10305]|uniref:EAL domain-containing protein n=1 Tax=Wenzhouxiangella sp. EGI_FJ10305 TaxID=3243768 RepID=UPI0035DF580F
MTDPTEREGAKAQPERVGTARLIDAHAGTRGARQKFLRYAEHRYRQFINDPQQNPHGVACIYLNNWRECRDHFGFGGLETVNGLIEERALENLADHDIFLRLADSSLVGVLWPGDGERDIEQWAADMLHKLTEAEYPIGSRWLTASFSIGLCWFDRRVRGAEEALLDAMHLAEQLSERGENQYRLFRPVEAPREELGSERQLAGQIQRALQSNRLRMVFQPLLAASDDLSLYYQVWARLISNSGKLIPARHFLGVARRHELIGALQRWTLRRSVHYLATAADDAPALRLLVNVSPEALSEPMLSWLRRVCDRHPQVGPRVIAEFEIFDLENRAGETRRAAEALSNLGIRIGLSGINADHLDHRPAGDSAIDYLRMAPEFAESMKERPELSGDFTAFIKQAHSADQAVIMPEVDREEQVIEFWQAGVDFIQGDYIQRPRTSPGQEK